MQGLVARPPGRCVLRRRLVGVTHTHTARGSLASHTRPTDPCNARGRWHCAGRKTAELTVVPVSSSFTKERLDQMRLLMPGLEALTLRMSNRVNSYWCAPLGNTCAWRLRCRLSAPLQICSCELVWFEFQAFERAVLGVRGACPLHTPGSSSLHDHFSADSDKPLPMPRAGTAARPYRCWPRRSRPSKRSRWTSPARPTPRTSRCSCRCSTPSPVCPASSQ